VADDVSVQLQGWDELGKTLGSNSLDAIKRTLRRSEKAAADVWIPAIQERVPVDTGRAQESITYKTQATPDGMTLEVGPANEGYYLLFQEFGTEFQKAQPSIRPAFEETTDQVLEALGKTFMEELSKLEEQKSQVLEIVQSQFFGRSE
jgi:HK97 gp10 family phage protein